MKNRSRGHIIFPAIILLALACLGLSACGGSSSGRNGVGPYDFTDYDSLDARREIREVQWEMTQYPIDDYYDMLAEQDATQAANDARSDFLYEEYLQEKYER